MNNKNFLVILLAIFMFIIFIYIQILGLEKRQEELYKYQIYLEEEIEKETH